MSVEGKVAVITGATGELGPVVSKRFFAAGANLALIARHQHELEELAHSLGDAEDRLLLLPTDLSDEQAVQQAAEAIRQKFGRADMLLNIAGGFVPGKPLAEVTHEALERLLTLNFRTAFNASRALVPGMMERGWGRVIAVSTPVAQQPFAQMLAYAVSKAALEALIFAMAAEGKSKGVTANLVMVRNLDTPKGRAEAPPRANFATWTKPAEVAETMLYLCSDEAGAINGARIPLYGRA